MSFKFPQIPSFSGKTEKGDPSAEKAAPTATSKTPPSTVVTAPAVQQSTPLFTPQATYSSESFRDISSPSTKEPHTVVKLFGDDLQASIPVCKTCGQSQTSKHPSPSKQPMRSDSSSVQLDLELDPEFYAPYYRFAIFSLELIEFIIICHIDSGKYPPTTWRSVHWTYQLAIFIQMIVAIPLFAAAFDYSSIPRLSNINLKRFEPYLMLIDIPVKVFLVLSLSNVWTTEDLPLISTLKTLIFLEISLLISTCMAIASKLANKFTPAMKILHRGVIFSCGGIFEILKWILIGIAGLIGGILFGIYWLIKKCVELLFQGCINLTHCTFEIFNCTRCFRAIVSCCASMHRYSGGYCYNCFNSCMEGLDSCFAKIGLDVRTSRLHTSGYHPVVEENAFHEDMFVTGKIDQVKVGYLMHIQTGRLVHPSELKTGPPHLIANVVEPTEDCFFAFFPDGTIQHALTKKCVHPEFLHVTTDGPEHLVLQVGGHVQETAFTFDKGHLIYSHPSLRMNKVVRVEEHHVQPSNVVSKYNTGYTCTVVKVTVTRQATSVEEGQGDFVFLVTVHFDLKNTDGGKLGPLRPPLKSNLHIGGVEVLLPHSSKIDKSKQSLTRVEGSLTYLLDHRKEQYIRNNEVEFECESLGSGRYSTARLVFSSGQPLVPGGVPVSTAPVELVLVEGALFDNDKFQLVTESEYKQFATAKKSASAAAASKAKGPVGGVSVRLTQP